MSIDIDIAYKAGGNNPEELNNNVQSITITDRVIIDGNLSETLVAEFVAGENDTEITDILANGWDA